MKLNQTTIEFFCASKRVETNPKFHRMRRHGDHVFATDGKCMARVKTAMRGIAQAPPSWHELFSAVEQLPCTVNHRDDVSDYYLDLLGRFDNVKFSTNNSGTPIHWECDGGDGFVMPMAGDSKTTKS